jgi:flagellar biosynthesis/type III secretory pathway chaperone
LSAEDTLCRQLLALAMQERAALIAGDTQRLQRLIARQEALAARWASLERKRLAALAPWAARLGCAVGDLTLDAVLPHLPAAEAEALAEVQATLRASLAELQRAKAINRALLERALEETTALLDLVRGVHAAPARYERSGAVQATAPLAVLDRRV